MKLESDPFASDLANVLRRFYEVSKENVRLRRALEELRWKNRIEMTVEQIERHIDAALNGGADGR